VEDAYDLEQLEASPFAAAIRCRDVEALRYPPDLSPVKTIRTLFLTIGSDALIKSRDARGYTVRIFQGKCQATHLFITNPRTRDARR
jgi:hypothetical protein